MSLLLLRVFPFPGQVVLCFIYIGLFFVWQPLSTLKEIQCSTLGFPARLVGSFHPFPSLAGRVARAFSSCLLQSCLYVLLRIVLALAALLTLPTRELPPEFSFEGFGLHLDRHEKSSYSHSCLTRSSHYLHPKNQTQIRLKFDHFYL